MKTIVEPKVNIDKLWGKQRSNETEVYRLMHYVLRVDHNDKILLHNVVTGQLVVAEQEEAEILNNLPKAFDPVMEQLVANHYLVPKDYDEHQQVLNLRTVLNRLDEAERNPGITTYTILTTTACNARCYYCYEKGSKVATMTEQTAEEIVTYIKEHCGSEKKVFITWFGGEPTLASNRITQICNGLQREGIRYQSKMVTNGYLFDESMVSEAKNLWNLRFAQICVDGTEKNYNYIKSYVGVKDNPYQRVMRNIQLLLEAGVRVKLRMNYDMCNYLDFKSLVDEIKERFHDNSLLMVSEHPIIGEYPDREGKVLHGSDSWFEETMIELKNIAVNAGVNREEDQLPCLNYRLCMAAQDCAVTITPEGNLVRCPERFDDSQVTGNVKLGITDHDLVQSWKRVADNEKCRECVLFPKCVTVENCLTSGLCMSYKKWIRDISAQAVCKYRDYRNKNYGGA